MSYRVTIDGKQLFGNGKSYEIWDEFIKSQGIQISEEGCYDGEITNFMGALEACERIVLDIEAERQESYKKNRYIIERTAPEDRPRVMAMLDANSLFDLSRMPEQFIDRPNYKIGLFDELYDLTRNGYLFLPYTLFRICEKKLIRILPSKSIRPNAFQLKPGKTLHVHAG